MPALSMPERSGVPDRGGRFYTPAMVSRPVSFRKLDIGAFIDAGSSLAGQAPLVEFPRLAEGLAPEADPAGIEAISWEAVGRQVPQRVGPPELWLDLSCTAHLPFSCQRCLQPVVLPVETDRSIRFVADEQTAAELDAELDDDVLVLSRSFDLLSLIEDELIMATPIVPRHDECPQPPLMSVSDPGVDGPSDAGDEVSPEESALTASGKPNPFAVLAQLKKKPG